MIFADLALARRLEKLDAWCGAECARARRELRPEADTASVAVAGGFAFYIGPDSPMNEAKGIGMAGPVSADDVEVITRVFHDRGIEAKVLVCPLADPSLLAGLSARGYRAAGFENVLYRPLDRLENFPTSDGLDVAWAGSGEADILGRTIAGGFAAPDEPGADMLEMVANSSRLEGMSGLMARVDGKSAGGAFVLMRDGVAMMAGASTLPPYRKRGIQSALTRARLAFASSTGADVAMQGAEPGSTSQRNAERAGFRVAYSKLILTLASS